VYSNRVTLPELLRILDSEGYRCTRRVLDRAIAAGRIPRPKKVGNWRLFDASDADKIREYIRTHSRLTPRRLGEGGVR
jgi:hypothetical protein